MSPGELFVDSLIFDDPMRYDSLLDAYHRLIGDRGLWWQHHPAAAKAGWADAIGAATRAVARRSGVDDDWLAEQLQQRAFWRTRRLVLATALDLVGAQ